MRCQTLQAYVSFLVLFLGAQNEEHKTNLVLRSTLTQSKVPVSHTLHLPGFLFIVRALMLLTVWVSLWMHNCT